ncbi:hypothetical protein [Acanthamoeba polyphaga mimivirus]|uniref:Uncharacterized protein n=2 Tax=Megamimivirinae TaxID=3044648 RepID=A0A2L2DJD1_MIMIV|nr:hypothetical protein LBA_00563 [Megavirus lba]AVG46282.1 hypothetical protein [Acanthamoeba polyphaga mimivirus]
MSITSSIFKNNIKQIFLDDSDHIYILDKRDILYLHDEQEHYPFLCKLSNIKQCFMIDKCTYMVYHDRTISVFDENLIKIKQAFNSWITMNIDALVYNSNDKIVITLEMGQIFINFDIGNDDQYSDINRICINNRIRHNSQYIQNSHLSYHDIKLIENILFAYKNNIVDVFCLDEYNISYLKTIYLDKIANHYLLDTTDIDTRSAVTNYNIQCLTNSEIPLYVNNQIYQKKGYCLFKIYNFLICYYVQNKYQDIIEPIIQLISSKTTNTTKFVEQQYVTTIVLDISTNIKIETNQNTYILKHNNDYYHIDDNVHKISFNEDNIDYSTIDNFYVYKDDTELTIDLNNQISTITQLISIIPNIYRLNYNNTYQFEQVDSIGNVISYGDGVTRHIYNNLRMEIDELLKNGLETFTLDQAFKLGQLIYFCNADGKQSFHELSGYFFYLISNKNNDDAELLIRKFKSADYELFIEQYTKYQNNPELLQELDIDIDYMEYILSSNLSSHVIELYKYIAKGFMYLLERNPNYKFIRLCHLPYLINRLISTDYFELALNFTVKNNKIDIDLYHNFKNIFLEVFGKLTVPQVSIFSQNLTGSQYYFGKINVVFGYKRPRVIHQVVYQDDIIDESINNSEEPIEETRLEIQNISKPEYLISTCNTEIIINVYPNQENIEKIINLLTIPDNSLKN